MDTCLSLNCFNVFMVAEGNCLVVYMYENVVQSSLNLSSEQRFYFISPHLENPVYFINYYNSFLYMFMSRNWNNIKTEIQKYRLGKRDCNVLRV
jgi:hypothetical protein